MGVCGPLPVDGEAKMTAEHTHTEVLYQNAFPCFGLWFRIESLG